MKKEKKQLDLGCGNTLRIREGYQGFGVDISTNLKNVKVADLAIEKLPYLSNSYDLVTTYDFVEHIPFSIYYNNKKRNCVVELFNEIYRVLKNDGIFHLEGPLYPHVNAFQDPTHLSFWTLESVNYFSGDYYGFHDHYGHTSRFEKIFNYEENNRLIFELKAIKNVPTSSEYKLKY